jgi:hypothetical protein
MTWRYPPWSAVAEGVASLANPWGELGEEVPWYGGFARDRWALSHDFWHAVTYFTLSQEPADVIEGQERLFDPESVGA